MNPKVSVVLPTYNSEKYIAKALRSLVNQSHRNFEIILIDDASTDLTVRIAQSFADKRLKIIKNERNRGVSYSRNLGIKEAKGKWIALLDSDDWYETERLAKLLEVANSKDADLVADDMYLFREGESQHWSTLLQEDSDRSLSSLTSIDAVKFVTSDRLKPINISRTWSFGYVKPIIRREFLLKNNIWYDENLKVGEDFTLYLECLRQDAKFYLLSQPYYHYRTRATSLSNRKPLEYLTQSCQITQRFINREICSTTESRLLVALRKNLGIFRQRIEFYRLVESIKNRRLLEVVERIVNNPYLLSDLYQRAMMILSNRLKNFLILETDNKVYQGRPSKQNQVVYSER